MLLKELFLPFVLAAREIRTIPLVSSSSFLKCHLFNFESFLNPTIHFLGGCCHSIFTLVSLTRARVRPDLFAVFR